MVPGMLLYPASANNNLIYGTINHHEMVIDD